MRCAGGWESRVDLDGGEGLAVDGADVGALRVDDDVVGLSFSCIGHLGGVDGVDEVLGGGPTLGGGRVLSDEGVDVPAEDLAVVTAGNKDAWFFRVPLYLVYGPYVALEGEQRGTRVTHVEDDDGVAVLGERDDDVGVEGAGLESDQGGGAGVRVSRLAGDAEVGGLGICGRGVWVVQGGGGVVGGLGGAVGGVVWGVAVLVDDGAVR